MGWFLTRSGNGKPRKPRAARKAAGGQSWDPQRTLAGLKALLAIGLIVAVVGGWSTARRELKNYVKTHHVAAVKTERVSLVNGPAWMSPRLKQDLQAVVADHLTDDPMDHASLERAAAALAASPWVEQVDRVKRSAVGTVKVVGAYREPVALVASGSGYHLVDAKSVRLPGLYTADQVERVGLPVITGVKASAPAEGRAWAGDDLKAGIALVDVLAAQPYLHQVRSFDVSQRDARGRVRLVLRTDKGLVRWGLPPGQEHAIEPEAATKRQWLANLFRNRGSIDAGGRVVDVFGAAVFVHKPNNEASADVQLGLTE